MRKDHYVIGILLLLGATLVSCRQSPTSPPRTDGEVRGGVELYDTLGNKMIDASGVQVSVEGSAQFALTDAEGIYSINGLPEGQIPLIFSKPGFAEVHSAVQSNFGSQAGNFSVFSLFELSHLSPDIVLRPFEACYVRYNFRDTQIYSYEAGGHFIHVWIYDSTYEEQGLARFSGRILDAPNYQGKYGASIRMYFSARESISPLDPYSFAFATDMKPVDSYDGSVDMDIYRDSLLHHGLLSDTKIYCAAFATGFLTRNQFYTDRASGKKIYTGSGPISSGIRSFVLP